ncbi:uncharacterized protein LOC127724021 isoform X1 [Mytilus californianus]|uniref:uncharacterized protein LOC127724021 isoform X1 n=1 Tax=Mytilus californianus TaxID=6549 RepID=UPI002247B664|nr:uncharacterized protein LOC127724021 isoform X1 [Mytilus californianus]
MDSRDGNVINISIKEENVDHSNDIGYGTTSELTNNSDTEILRPLHLFSYNDARNLVRYNDTLNNASKLSISTGNYLNQRNINQIKIKAEQDSDVIPNNFEQESTVYNNQINKVEEEISNENAPIISSEYAPTDTKTTDLFQDLSVSRYDEQNKGEKCKVQHSSGPISNVVLEFWEVDKSGMSCNVVNASSQLTENEVNENETCPNIKQKENVTSASDILKRLRTNLNQNPKKSTSVQYLLKENTGNNERSQMRQRYLSSKSSDKIHLTPGTCTSETFTNNTGKLLSEKSRPSILNHRRKVNIGYKNISEPTHTKVPKCSSAPRKIKPITKVEQRFLQDGLGKVQNGQVTDNVLLDKVNRSAANQVVSQKTSSDPFVPCPEQIVMYSESFDHDTPRIIQQTDIGSKGSKNNRIVYVENSAEKRYIEDRNKRKDSQLARSEFVKLPTRIPDYKKKNLVSILPKPVPNVLPENAANASTTTLPIQNLPTAPATDMASLINNPPQYSNPDEDSAKQDANQSSLQFLPTALSHSSLQNNVVLLGQNQSYSMLPDNLFTTMQPITYIPLIVPLESAITQLPLGSMHFPVSSAHSNPVTFSSENLQQIADEQRLNTSSEVIVVNRTPVNPTIHPNSINNLGYLSNTVGLQPNFFSLGNSVQQEHLSKIPSFQVSPGNMAHTLSFDANNHKHSLPNDSFSITSENRKILNYQLSQGLAGQSQNNSSQLPLEETLDDSQVKCEAKHSPLDFTLNGTITESSTHSSAPKAGMNTPDESIGDLSLDKIIGTPHHANYETLQKLINNVTQEQLLRPKINWKNLRRPNCLGNMQKWKSSSSYRMPGKKRKYTITNPLVLDRLKTCCADRYEGPMPSNVLHNGNEVESADLNIVVESVYSLSNGTDKAKDDLLHCKWFLKRQRSYFINKFKRNMKLYGIRNCKEFIDPKLSAPCFVVLDSLRNCRKTTKIYTKKIKACTQECRDMVVADFCNKISKGKIMKQYKQEKERNKNDNCVNQIYDCDKKGLTDLDFSTNEIMTLLKNVLFVNMVHNSTGQTSTPLPTDIKDLIQLFPRIVDANDNEFRQVKIANNSILINASELESDNLSAIVNEKLRQEREIEALQLRNSESNTPPPDSILNLSDDLSVILSESSDEDDEIWMKLNKGEESESSNNNDDNDPTALIAKYTYHRRSSSPWSDVSDFDYRINALVETAANIDSSCSNEHTNLSAIPNTKEQTVTKTTLEGERRNGVQFDTLTRHRSIEPSYNLRKRAHKETCKDDSNSTLSSCSEEDLSEDSSNVQISTTESIMEHLQWKDLLSDSMRHYPTIEIVVPKLQEFKSSLNGMLNQISYKHKKKKVREPSYQNQMDSSDIDIEIINDEVGNGKHLSTNDVGRFKALTDRLVTDIFQESQTMGSECSTESNLETISLEDENESEKDEN